MHLSDDQLNQIEQQQGSHHQDEISDADHNRQQTEHLKNCNVCKEKLRNLQAFHDKLNIDTDKPLPQLQWQLIERELVVPKNERVLEVIGNKIKPLQITLVAIAASLMILLVYPQFTDTPIHSAERQLAAVVEENHLLQLQLSKIKPTSLLQTVVFKSTEIQLQKIDSRIQLSYLDNFPIEQKISLWNERKQLLTHSLTNNIQRTVVII